MATAAIFASVPEKTRAARLSATDENGGVSAVTVTVPEGYTYSTKNGTLEAWSTDERISLKITLLPLPPGLVPKTKEAIEKNLRASTAFIAPDSVEGKTIPFALNQAQGIGLAANFTDKSEVGQPTPKGRGHYKVMTSAFVSTGGAFVICTILGDDWQTSDYKAAIRAIEGIRETK